MSATVAFIPGGYAFIPGVFQYSGGVKALSGHRIERVRFAEPVPLTHGFERIAATIRSAGRPLASFCACELRSPAPFTEAGFRAFNEIYVGTLEKWGVIVDGRNAVARSNVCPAIHPPAEPTFHAFSFTTEARDAPASFVVAGSGEAPEGKDNYRDHIVARGDLTPEGIRKKALWVLGEMERRMAAMDATWGDTTAVQLYTTHDVYPFLAEEIVRRGAARNGLTWHFNRPPVQEIEYEMDCRSVSIERVI
jgi:hypothetical protein